VYDCYAATSQPDGRSGLDDINVRRMLGAHKFAEDVAYHLALHEPRSLGDGIRFAPGFKTKYGILMD
jgi:hypothetical protein